MCKNELHYYITCGDTIINHTACSRQEEYQWNPVTTVEINTLCQRCAHNPDRQRRSLEELERLRQRVSQDIAFEQERRVEIDEFRRLLQDEQEISANVIMYVVSMMNRPNPFHPTKANAIRLIYAYIILVEDYIDHTGYIYHMGLSVETMVNTTKPEFPGPIYVEKTIKDGMKAAIELNAFYVQREQEEHRAESILAILTPVAINSLAPDEVNCTICSEPLGQEAFLGAIELACRTPCNHIFGKRCITHWLKDNNTCPTCRNQLAITEGEDEY